MAAFILIITLFTVIPVLITMNHYRKKIRKLTDSDERLTVQVERVGTQMKARAQKEVLAQKQHVEALAKRLIKDTFDFLKTKLTTSNFATSRKRLETVLTFCEKHGYFPSKEEQNQFIKNLQEAYKEVVKKDLFKQEQARLKAQIREEQKLEREREKEIKRLENEELAIQTALQKALKRAQDEHDSEVERLQGLLEEAKAKAERAKSQAQLTKSGYVYVISNVGSFGEEVFKIGMTRRLVPMDRVKELGDASVPFPFDVHMMIACDDAPKLENALHRELHMQRLNKVNFRKEFFKVSIEEISRLVEKHHGTVEYVIEPEALQYRESLTITKDDYNFVSEQFADELQVKEV